MCYDYDHYSGAAKACENVYYAHLYAEANPHYWGYEYFDDSKAGTDREAGYAAMEKQQAEQDLYDEMESGSYIEFNPEYFNSPAHYAEPVELPYWLTTVNEITEALK